MVRKASPLGAMAMSANCEMENTYSWPLPRLFSRNKCRQWMTMIQITPSVSLMLIRPDEILRPRSSRCEFERHRGSDHGAASWLRINEKLTMD